MDIYGPVELLNNLKDTGFIQKHGRINVSENMFEFPLIPKSVYKGGDLSLQQGLLDLLS